MRYGYLAKIASVSSLEKGARPCRSTAVWVDAAEIRRKPSRIHGEGRFLPAPARSYGHQRICRRRTKEARGPVHGPLQPPRAQWRGIARGSRAFCLVFPCRETGSEE